MMRELLLAGRAISILAVVSLAALWIVSPQQPVEPWIILASTCAGLFEVGRRRARLKAYFPDNTDDFYAYYARSTQRARREIWLTSDGFNMKNPNSRRFGRIMLNARRTALERGVTIYWFQITVTMHLNWLKELRALKARYANFRLFVNEQLENVPNVCAIDPELRSSTAETMEHRSGMFGQGSEAASASFVHGDKQRAKQARQLVADLIESPGSRELDVGGLEALYEKLLTERVEQLERWAARRCSTDISESGVFDEVAISKYLEQHRAIRPVASE